MSAADTESRSNAEPVSASYDALRRRRTLRRGRERGCWLYIPADELVTAGYDLNDDPPWYRVWGTKKGVLIRLYKRP